jgi:hypothetical protein
MALIMASEDRSRDSAHVLVGCLALTPRFIYRQNIETIGIELNDVNF